MADNFEEHWAVTNKLEMKYVNPDTYYKLVVCAYCKHRFRAFKFFGTSRCAAAFIESRDLVSGKVSRHYKACAEVNYGFCKRFEAR